MRNQLQQLDSKQITILDVCTGSGCIAIALAKAFPQATVYATDIADQAIACSQENIVHNKTSNVKLIKSDLFKSIPPQLKFDLIVGNPPYIAADEWTTLEPSVTLWEDKRALVAPDGGLGIIAQIINQAPSLLKPNSDLEEHNIPQLVLEIDFTRGTELKN